MIHHSLQVGATGLRRKFVTILSRARFRMLRNTFWGRWFFLVNFHTWSWWCFWPKLNPMFLKLRSIRLLLSARLDFWENSSKMQASVLRCQMWCDFQIRWIYLQIWEYFFLLYRKYRNNCQIAPRMRKMDSCEIFTSI